MTQRFLLSVERLTGGLSVNSQAKTFRAALFIFAPLRLCVSYFYCPILTLFLTYFTRRSRIATATASDFE